MAATRGSLPSQRSYPTISLVSSDEEEPSSSAIKRRKGGSGAQAPSNRSQPIVIDDEEDVEDITPTPRQPEVDLISIGHMRMHPVYQVLKTETKIVGIRYYRGIATKGENLLLAREPRNQYDCNAIRVDNVANVQVGQSHPPWSEG